MIVDYVVNVSPPAGLTPNPLVPGPGRFFRGGHERDIMGKVQGNWITGAHSGRACKHEDIYTKINKKTGACYSVKLCNPSHERNEAQQKVMNTFARVSKAVNDWLNKEKAAQSEAYMRAKAIFDRQSRYATLRGMMISKGMYTVSSDGTITIDVDARTNFKTVSGSAQLPGGSGSGSTSGSQTGGSGSGSGSGGSSDGDGGFE